MTRAENGWDEKVGVPGEVLERGACRGMDTDVFFPEVGHPQSGEVAKAICRACPVVEACRSYALADSGLRGVWGGLSEEERKRWNRRRRRTA